MFSIHLRLCDVDMVMYQIAVRRCYVLLQILCSCSHVTSLPSGISRFNVAVNGIDVCHSTLQCCHVLINNGSNLSCNVHSEAEEEGVDLHKLVGQFHAC